jgi:hypothetical protein
MEKSSLNDSALRSRFFITRIRRAGRLDKQKVNLFVGYRPVFDPFRHDEKFARPEFYCLVAEFDFEAPFQNQKEVIRVWMRMPHKLAL